MAGSTGLEPAASAVTESYTQSAVLSYLYRDPLLVAVNGLACADLWTYLCYDDRSNS
jgi:hypothetical protein